METDSLPYHADSVLEYPIDGLELERWQKLTENLARLSGVPVVMVNHAFDKGIEVLATNSHSNNPYQYGATVPKDCNVYCHYVVRNKEALAVGDASLDSQWQSNPEYVEDGFDTYAGVPLEWPDGRVFGTLCFMNTGAKENCENYMSLLKDYKDIIDFELKLLDQNRKLRALSVVDEMTGLFNRRGLNASCKKMLALANRYDRKVAAIFLDLDNLKPLNDRYGHEFGDVAIRRVAQVINTCIRSYDIAARMGGDEFLMLCLLDDVTEAQRILKRLEEAFEQTLLTLPDNNTSSLSVSIGHCVGQPNNHEEVEALITRADEQMYHSKQSRKRS